MESKQERREKNWNVVNTTTIIDWISSSNLNILLLDTYLLYLRSILRFNTLWSLVISSVTSTVSVTQFTISDISDPMLSFIIKVVIFITSIMTSLITGYIKVEKIQETIELVEEHKTKWLDLMYCLSSELQVGMDFRNDASIIINAKKEEYNNISAKQVFIPNHIRQKVSQFLVKKANVESKMEEKRRVGCGFSLTEICCSCSKCCIWTDEDYNMERINIKLSLYHTINKSLKKELLDLFKSYPEEIKELQFQRTNDMFAYKIINTSYVKQSETYNNQNTVCFTLSKDIQSSSPVKSAEPFRRIRRKTALPKYRSRREAQSIANMTLKNRQSATYEAKNAIIKQSKLQTSPLPESDVEDTQKEEDSEKEMIREEKERLEGKREWIIKKSMEEQDNICKLLNKLEEEHAALYSIEVSKRTEEQASRIESLIKQKNELQKKLDTIQTQFKGSLKKVDMQLNELQNSAL